MDKLKSVARILLWTWYLVIVALGAAITAAAISGQPTESDPSGGAGFYAAMMALCVASLFLTYNTIKIEGWRPPDYVVNLLVGFGLLVSAYLWVSSELEAHPFAPELPNAMLVLGVAVASIALLLLPLVYLIYQVWENFIHNDNDLD